MGKMGFYLRYPRYLSSPDLTFSFQKGELTEQQDSTANPAALGAQLLTFRKFFSHSSLPARLPVASVDL